MLFSTFVSNKPPTDAKGAGGARAVGEVLFSIVFAGILFLPLIGGISRWEAMGLVEKRALAPPPALPSSRAAWAAFPAAADRYLNDHFGFRAEMIGLNSYLRYLGGFSASPRILVGKAGWLFYIDDPNFEFFRGHLLNQQRLEEWTREMETRRAWLAARGIQFLILPAPRKETIYPELLPYWLQRAAAPTVVDQVKNTSLRDVVIDVRQQLRERKGAVPMYGPYDFHWNADGAFVGYRAVVDRVRQKFPDMASLQETSITLTPMPPEQVPRDLVLMLGINRFVHVEGREYVAHSTPHLHVTYTTPKTDWTARRLITTGVARPRILLIRDSFANAMIPYLEDTFSAIGLTHLQDGLFPEEFIEYSKPDIVVLQVQENGIGVI